MTVDEALAISVHPHTAQAEVSHDIEPGINLYEHALLTFMSALITGKQVPKADQYAGTAHKLTEAYLAALPNE